MGHDQAQRRSVPAMITLNRSGEHSLSAHVLFNARLVDADVYGSIAGKVAIVAESVASRDDIRPNDTVRVAIEDRAGKFYHLTYKAASLLRVAAEDTPPADVLLLAQEQAIDAPRAVSAARAWAGAQPTSWLDRLGL